MLTRSDPNGVCVVLRVALEHRRVVEPAQLHRRGKMEKIAAVIFLKFELVKKQIALGVENIS